MPKIALLFCREGMTYVDEPSREDREAVRRLATTALEECGVTVETLTLSDAKRWEDYVDMLKHVSGVVQLTAWPHTHYPLLALIATRLDDKLPVLELSARNTDTSLARQAVVEAVWGFADKLREIPSEDAPH